MPGGQRLDHLARFARIGLTGHVPHPTTLMKLTTRFGPAVVQALNEALLARAVEARVVRATRLRADTTVVPAKVSYPTDSGLLTKAVRRIAATVERIHAADGATRTKVRDRSRAAGSRGGGCDRRQAAVEGRVRPRCAARRGAASHR